MTGNVETSVLSTPGKSRRYSDWRPVFDGRYKLIEEAEANHSFYDLETDPDETKDFYNDLTDRVEALASYLPVRS